MRNRIYLILLALSCLSATCRKANIESDAPECVLKMIKQLNAENVSNPPSSVWRYQYNGQTVYYIPAKCCDIQSILMDSKCNVICSPDGGFTGKGDGKCQDFFDKRTDEVLIWKDDRK